MLAQFVMVPMEAKLDELSPSTAGLVGALLLIGFIGWIGRKLDRKRKWDDVLKIIVTLLTIGALLSRIPVIQSLGNALQTLISKIGGDSSIKSTLGDGFVFILLGGLIIGCAVWYYARTKNPEKSALGPLIILVILMSSFFGLSWVQQLTGWFNDLSIMFLNAVNYLLNLLLAFRPFD